MRLRFAAGTTEYLRTVAPVVRRELREALRAIEEDPRHPDLDLRLLRTKGQVRTYRARVRKYRITFTPRSDATYVLGIQHRSEGYEWLDRLDPWPK